MQPKVNDIGVTPGHFVFRVTVINNENYRLQCIGSTEGQVAHRDNLRKLHTNPAFEINQFVTTLDGRKCRIIHILFYNDTFMYVLARELGTDVRYVPEDHLALACKQCY